MDLRRPCARATCWTRSPRPSAPARCIAAGRSTWSSRRSARWRRPGSAPPSTTISRRSARRSATRSAARSGGPRAWARCCSSRRRTRSRTCPPSSTCTRSAGADGLFPDNEGGAQSRRFFERLFELFGPDSALRLAFLTVDGRRIAACVSFETDDAVLYYNAGVDPEARELSPGVVMVERLVRRALERGATRLTSSAATSRTSTSGGGGRANPATAGPPNCRAMTRPLPGDPCVAPMVHLPVPGRQKVRVVQVMATGTNGGAQEHVFNLVNRLDHDFYDVSIVSLSPGSAVRKLQKAGFEVTVIDEPDDVIATASLATYLAEARADVIHNHMYRAEVVGTKAAIALATAGHRRPWVISDRPLVARPVRGRPGAAPPSDAVHGPADRGVQGDRREGGGRGRQGAERVLIYNGVDLDRLDHQEPCCTPASTAWSWPSIVGVVGRLEPRRATRRCSRPGRSCSSACPTRTS
ncbi:MAG: GNAT family N-acetyltransferase [Chloroflexota bacterium]